MHPYQDTIVKHIKGTTASYQARRVAEINAELLAIAKVHEDDYRRQDALQMERRQLLACLEFRDKLAIADTALHPTSTCPLTLEDYTALGKLIEQASGFITYEQLNAMLSNDAMNALEFVLETVARYGVELVDVLPGSNGDISEHSDISARAAA